MKYSKISNGITADLRQAAAAATVVHGKIASIHGRQYTEFQSKIQNLDILTLF